MSQPLLATYRITIPYTVSSIAHKFRAYVKSDGSVTAGVPNITYVDASIHPWNVAANNLAGYLAPYLNCTFGAALFEHLVSGVWLPLDSVAVTATPSAGAAQAARQLTVVLRDSAFKKVKLVVMEGVLTTAAFHTTAYSGLDAVLTALLAGYNPATVDAGKPLLWQVSRGDRYFLASPLVASTGTLNRKIRRRRGLA